MKNRIVKIYNNNPSIYHIYDRSNLIEGVNRKGEYIPAGGIILSNNLLGGYIKLHNKKKWKIVGKVLESQDIFKEKNGIYNSQKGGNLNYKELRNENIKDNEINLKRAIELLRDHYEKNFNQIV